ncbi:60S ribosomal protein L17-B [Neolecta irregularis DAH-3]|uniref:60S ribosomal protein L17-B n=1 Tax=Neolecta irregularis (strain DAH-3) TaxID=1198029 RepID=A0A1U7LPK5_NEOID|nr:60S ribosomal protein L17-B [Neolecta irregularis DAH-3]|eukprot:OLL24558.1 60S ribosomal protein L17-B [Neolecta irregularis DAH-3]
MVRYTARLEDPSKGALAQPEYTRTRFRKYSREAVGENERALPFTRFHDGVGRMVRKKEFGTSRARLLVETVHFVTELLKNFDGGTGR